MLALSTSPPLAMVVRALSRSEYRRLRDPELDEVAVARLYDVLLDLLLSVLVTRCRSNAAVSFIAIILSSISKFWPFAFRDAVKPVRRESRATPGKGPVRVRKPPVVPVVSIRLVFDV